MFKDDIRRAEALAASGIHYVDVGTSGGVWGGRAGILPHDWGGGGGRGLSRAHI